MDNAIDYEKLGAEIAKKLNKLQITEYTLWSSEDCAEYFQCSRKHLTDKIAKSVGFPDPVRHTRNRWFAAAVVKWAKGSKRK
ncbi:hypothetical protein TDB9533_03557 [Thalassocella blandensis]|nr:hypothetical protein TDB9533_03557 [Thalassocella blandensis]